MHGIKILSVGLSEKNEWSRAIQKNIRNIFQDLDSDEVTWYLLQEDGITTEDVEQIENEPGSHKKVPE